MAIDQAKLQALLGRAVVDIGANFHAALVVTGDKLRLFRTLRELGPTTPADLAKRTGTHERYIREWLSAMAAGGYITYDAGTAQFSLSEEQALALLDADLPGAFVLAQATVKSEPRITEIFRSGEGMGWHEHDHRLFEGTERFFRPGYAVNLVPTRIPALEGVRAKLEKGGRVADIGCGHGSSTILMAKAFPASRFVGLDYHGPSIDSARQAATREGVGDRIGFEVASARDYPGTGYDLVAFFDSLHDMGDPVGIARHVRQSLAPRGDVAARRAVRARPAGGKPEPRRTDVLRGVDDALHAELPVAGSGDGARGPGRRSPLEEGRHGGRIHTVPACRGDSLQPRARSAPLTDDNSEGAVDAPSEAISAPREVSAGDGPRGRPRASADPHG